MLKEYCNSEFKNVSSVTTNKEMRTLRGASVGSNLEINTPNLEIIKQKLMSELRFYGTNLGEINYRLAKILYENTKDLGFTDTSRIYGFVSDFLGISIKTIKNLVKIYKKLEKFTLWHNETGLFKLRLFQLAYYIDKNTSEVNLVLEKAYYDIVNDFKLRVWFENSSYKDILVWFKERFKTYLRIFKPKVTFTAICDICHRELKPEDYKKDWDFLPICFSCYDMLREENKDKLAILKHTIAKKLSETNIEDLKRELEDTKRILISTIDDLDKIRLAKSRKWKKIIAKIEI
jgi:hypothetical protein